MSSGEQYQTVASLRMMSVHPVYSQFLSCHAMRKRKVNEYFECYGIPGVSDSAIRKVVSRLKKQKEDSHAHSFKEKFQHLDGALLREEKTGIYTLNLQFYIDTLC